MEMQDVDYPPHSDDGTLSPDTDFHKWAQLLILAFKAAGTDLTVAAHYKQWMIDAGFENVTEVIHRWPQNPWPTDRHERELGRWTLASLLDGVQGFSLAPMTRYLGMTREQIEVLLMGVRKDMVNKDIHAYWSMCVLLLVFILPRLPGVPDMLYTEESLRSRNRSAPSHQRQPLSIEFRCVLEAPSRISHVSCLGVNLQTCCKVVILGWLLNLIFVTADDSYMSRKRRLS